MRCYSLDARTPTTGSPNIFCQIHFGCRQTSADTVHVYIHCVYIKIRKIKWKEWKQILQNYTRELYKLLKIIFCIHDDKSLRQHHSSGTRNLPQVTSRGQDP